MIYPPFGGPPLDANVSLPVKSSPALCQHLSLTRGWSTSTVGAGRGTAPCPPPDRLRSRRTRVHAMAARGQWVSKDRGNSRGAVCTIYPAPACCRLDVPMLSVPRRAVQRCAAAPDGHGHRPRDHEAARATRSTDRPLDLPPAGRLCRKTAFDAPGECRRHRASHASGANRTLCFRYQESLSGDSAASDTNLGNWLRPHPHPPRSTPATAPARRRL